MIQGDHLPIPSSQSTCQLEAAHLPKCIGTFSTSIDVQSYSNIIPQYSTHKHISQPPGQSSPSQRFQHGNASQPFAVTICRATAIYTPIHSYQRPPRLAAERLPALRQPRLSSAVPSADRIGPRRCFPLRKYLNWSATRGCNYKPSR